MGKAFNVTEVALSGLIVRASVAVAILDVVIKIGKKENRCFGEPNSGERSRVDVTEKHA